MKKWNPCLGTSGLTQTDNFLLLKTQGSSFPLLSLSIKDEDSFQSWPSSIIYYNAQIHFTGLHVAHSWSTGTFPARSVLWGLPAILQGQGSHSIMIKRGKVTRLNMEKCATLELY